MNLGARLKAERERLGLSQTDFAAIAGASKHAQINWEKGAASPNAVALEAWEKRGLDVLYVITGRSTPSLKLPGDTVREMGVPGQAVRDTGVALGQVVGELKAAGAIRGKVQECGTSGDLAPIDSDRLSLIVEMLEAAARQAGRKWPVKKLVAVAAEIYNVLVDEVALDEPKVERILKLVVNR